ncbi:4Fe-4S ferredoxin, iron-sulpur binding domain-containing protein [Desulfovibrio sp. X2]|uniref:(Fe-S)-binding protein n=1 Tax=Desulfovibrio sp. X2 TaxID=941449 RepID=UPI000358AC39|nr:(Fe-S)-binding protein [Desulfovibrio sp. X2]EPR36346.1 4Fe-4S ferredoxin, iron-sulpur binding domain-containing protein [Desulfovibrio sp. X2]
MEPIQPRDIPAAIKDKLAGLNLNACFTCGMCSSGCPITGTPGMEGWDTRKVIRMLAYGMVDEVVESKFPWICTGCGRCAYACPQHIDIVPIFGFMKHLRNRDKVPGILHKGVEKVLASGNNMDIPMQDYLATLKDVGEELADEECPGFYVPVDKKDAEVLFFPNSKEIYGDFEDMKWWWKIFYAAGENWTVPSENWEAVDWGLFTGNYEATKVLAQRKIDLMHDLQVGTMIMPDCGGGSYGCRTGMKMCELENPDNKASFLYLYDYLKKLIEDGRITLDKSVHEGRTFVWHDSCKHGRELERHFGRGYYEEPRWILDQCVDSRVEFYPNRGNNFCCGAGGGNWPMPYEQESAAHGRFKFEQIKNSKADVVVVGCSNCRDQMMRRLPKYYKDYQYEVKYIWQVIAEALVLPEKSEAEIEKLAAEATAQWERLGVEDMEY